MMNIPFDWKEIDSLIALFHAKGICYLIGNGSSGRSVDENINPVHFIERLAACNYPLVENASISLFLLHPDLASSVEEALQHSKHDIAENIAVLTLATLYLQQWWFFRLAFALGHLPRFPEAPFTLLWEQHHFPSPDRGYGLDGLLALQEYQQRRYGAPLNFLDDWQNQINHLLAQEEAHCRELSADAKEILVQLSREEGTMPMSRILEGEKSYENHSRLIDGYARCTQEPLLGIGEEKSRTPYRGYIKNLEENVFLDEMR